MYESLYPLEEDAMTHLAGQIARWVGRLVTLFALVGLWRPGDVVAQIPGDAGGSEAARMDAGDVTFAQVGDVDVDDSDRNTTHE